MMGFEGCRWISQALHSNETLSELDLSNNNIKNESCRWISQALQSNSTLIRLLSILHLKIIQYFQFRKSNYSRRCRWISQGLQINKTLTQLYMGGNDIGDEGCSCLCQALQSNSTLYELWLSAFDQKNPISS